MLEATPAEKLEKVRKPETLHLNSLRLVQQRWPHD
jgi:hypothetical protein